MSKYIVPEADRTQIQSNKNRSERHEFWYEDWNKFYFDENTIQYLDFDYDSIFQTEFNKTLTEYLSWLGKKAKLKADRYVSEYADIKDVNYNLFWLKEERIVSSWELVGKKYRDSYDEETSTYSDLVVEEEIVYNRDNNWYIKNRDKHIKWIDEEENTAETKDTKKYYSVIEASNAWEKKRNYILVDLKIKAIWLIAQTEQIPIEDAEVLWKPMLTINESYMWSYVRWDTQPLIDSITNETSYAWLDNDIGWWTTIRQYLLSIIDYA